MRKTLALVVPFGIKYLRADTDTRGLRHVLEVCMYSSDQHMKAYSEYTVVTLSIFISYSIERFTL